MKTLALLGVIVSFILAQGNCWATESRIIAVSAASDVRFNLMRAVIENTYPDVKIVRGGVREAGSKIFIQGPGGAGETALSKDLVKTLLALQQSGEYISTADVCEQQRKMIGFAYGQPQQPEKVVERIVEERVVYVPEQVPGAVPVYIQTGMSYGYYAGGVPVVFYSGNGYRGGYYGSGYSYRNVQWNNHGQYYGRGYSNRGMNVRGGNPGRGGR